MALVIADRVKETTTTTGTGNLNLAGAASGFQSFVSGIGDTNTVYYALIDANGAWEVGLGTVSDGDPDTLSRPDNASVIASSNSNNRINLSSGTHTVFATYPAGKAVYLDASGNLSYTVDISSDTNLAAGTGITLTGDTLSTNDSEIDHDSLSGFVANEHIDWTTDQGSTNIHSGNYTDTNTMGSGFVLEDGDGTEVTITENKEVKFVEGAGIDIDWTDTSDGSDADPYDLTFTVTGLTTTEIAAATLVTEADDIADNDNDTTIPTSAAVKDYADHSESILKCINASGSTLNAGECVYLSGHSGTQIQVDLADNSDSAKMPAIGIVKTSAANNAAVDIVTHGKLLDLDTSTPAYSVGDELYVNSTGGLTTTFPAGESGLIQKIAKVVRVHASSGEIYIMGAGRTNAVPNLNSAKIFLGNSSNKAVAAAISGDISISNTGAVTISNDTIGIAQLDSMGRGKLFVGDASGDPSLLAVGSANTVLQSDGSDATWGSVSNAMLANSAITVAAGSDSTAISLGETITFAGTTNEVEVSESSGTVTIGLPNNVTIAGNLTVNGTTTTVNSTTLSVADPLIILANGNDTTDSVDIGFYGLYDTSGSQDLYAGLFRDANDSGKFKLFKDLQAAPTTTVNTSGAGYAVATLVANIEGDVTGDLTGNADTVTTNANLTGHVTSTGNATVLGSFTVAQLSTALSDASISGNNNGDVTLAGSLDYITISGQEITRNAIDLTADVTGTLPVGNGGTGLTSIATLLNSNVTPTSLGLVIGTDVQAYDADIAAIAALSSADGNFIVGSASGWVAESGATARASLGLGSIATLSSIDISANTNLAGGTGITLTGDTLSTTDSEIVHDNLSGFEPNEHIDHSSVSITAGNGLTGGGTIASTRTINVVGGDGITANADEIEVSVDGSTIELSATDGSGSVRVKDGGVTNAKLANSSITVSDSESTPNTTAIALGGTLTFAGTANETTVIESGGTITIGLPSSITADLTGDVTGNADTVTVTDSTSNTDFPVVFHDESNALLDDTGAFEYNPSTGTITLTGAVIDFNGSTGNNKLELTDNLASALDITESSNSYIKFNTQDKTDEVTYSKEAVEISKPLKCTQAIHSSISKTNAVSTGQTLKGGGTGNVVTLDLASAGFFRVQLDNNVDEIWFKNQAEGQKVIIRFEQDGTGSRTVDFSAFYAYDGTAVVVNFAGGTAPTLTTTASKADIIGFLNFGIPAGSVHYYNAVVVGQDFS